jgi:DNA-binding CsgD family transcriptional regulator
MSNLEIAKQLAISVGTLRTHLKNIYNKVKDAGESVEFLPFERK